MAALQKVYIIDEIEPFIYIGSWQAATDPDSIEDAEIDVVFSIEMNKKPQHVLDMYNKHNVISHELHIDNVQSEDIQKFFPRMFAIIQHYTRQKCRILIHCNDGYGRAVITVAAFILIRQYLRTDMKLIKKPIADDIMKYVCGRRKHANPLAHFVGCLRTFENGIRNNKYDITPLDMFINQQLTQPPKKPAAKKKPEPESEQQSEPQQSEQQEQQEQQEKEDNDEEPKKKSKSKKDKSKSKKKVSSDDEDDEPKKKSKSKKKTKPKDDEDSD